MDKLEVIQDVMDEGLHIEDAGFGDGSHTVFFARLFETKADAEEFVSLLQELAGKP